jgi:glycine C-acetyltransferase
MRTKEGFKVRYNPIETFNMNFLKMAKPEGPDLFARTKVLSDYVDPLREAHLWLYSRRMLTGVSTEVLGMDEASNMIHGINFASADYLGLAQSPKAIEAAVEAARTFGVNSAGSPLAFGTTKYYSQLIEELKEFWDAKALMLYSAGWLAGFGVIKGLIRPYDHVVIDNLAHNCLLEGAKAATPNVHRTPHLDEQAVEDKIIEIRKSSERAAILVCTEGLYSMDSDSPDLNSLQQRCLRLGAYLLVDCAHDFGAMGETGRGVWQVQNLRDRSNVILIGTGSKTLSTNIGFAACEDPRVIEYLKIFSTAYMFTNAINPVQAATSLANLRILGSEEGRQRRRKVIENYLYLRERLEATGNYIFGKPCAILPLLVGNEFVCRMVCRLMMDNGIHVNGIEFPVVSIGKARLRVNLMPQHTQLQLDTFVEKFNACKAEAEKIIQDSYAEFERRASQAPARL